MVLPPDDSTDLHNPPHQTEQADDGSAYAQLHEVPLNLAYWHFIAVSLCSYFQAFFFINTLEDVEQIVEDYW